MGVQFSPGSGVVNGTGISSSRPVHRLVGVAVTEIVSVAVGTIGCVGEGVLEGEIFVGVGDGSLPAPLAQDVLINRIMKITVVLIIGKRLCEFI